MTPRVLVVGDVINDLIVRPLSATVPDSDTRAEIVQRPGGSAANQACWLGLLGAPVTFVGRVGRADLDRHVAELRRWGVQPALVADDTETGSIVIVVAEGARTMYVDRGANLNLHERDVPEAAWADAGLLHLTGYSFFERGTRAAALALLDRARARGVPVSVDPSSVGFLSEVGPEEFLRWTDGAELCFPNRAEAALLTGTDDPAEAAVRLTERCRTAVVTLDADGAVVASRGSAPVAIPALPGPVLDTTGAGDAFCAGFLRRWTVDRDPVAAARDAVRVATSALRRLGGRPGPVAELAAGAPAT
ncbi:carbohydrate kinase family protein [Isoptericola sp. b441]|uniref:Carbohydrate kinase family protein n=1 Tax=Actinotalea lenta TaxID=3064654 RepID=A0ABT9D8I1_9CELL|nr:MULTISPECIES: carbohydrate kinase family protein [unclassified Isoptericola]MDO8106761.1 carbohydrate kinase family protein [Isoptericola sp. b441]MDO8121527.1 carbohydrate kinase family protein [Isoptericola sp. b490]